MRRLLVLLLAAAALLPGVAEAHQSPAGCASNHLDLGLARNLTMARPGQTVDYTVTASNVGVAACDVTGATVTFTPPTGAATTLGGLTFLAGALSATQMTPQWTVPVGQAAGPAVATASVSGTLHDSPADSAIQMAPPSVSVAIVDPKLSLTVTPTPNAGQAPLSVTFHFQLKNLSAPPDPLTGPAVNHPLCTPAAYSSGDTDGDDAIDIGETWDLTCTRVFNAGGTYSATAVASATSTSDNLLVSATAPSTSVTVAPPVSTAHLTLTAAPSPASGFAPLAVTYTYTVLNDGPTTPIKDIAVQDGGCSPVVTSAPAVPLAAGASRGFTCSASFPLGTFTSTAIASGIDTVTNTAVTSAQVSTAVTASSAPEPQPTAIPQPAEPTPTPTSSTRVKFSYTGRFTPARSCRGTVALTLKAGGRTVASKRVRLDSRCRYKVSFDVLRSRLGKATTVTVTAKAGRRSASRRLNVPSRT